MLMQQKYPIRFGIVFACEDGWTRNVEEESLKLLATPRDTCLLITRIKEKYNANTLMQFVFSLANEVLGDSAESEMDMYGGMIGGI